MVLFVGLYQFWYAQGYQEFAGMESSVTTKVLLLYDCYKTAVYYDFVEILLKFSYRLKVTPSQPLALSACRPTYLHCMRECGMRQTMWSLLLRMRLSL